MASAYESGKSPQAQENSGRSLIPAVLHTEAQPLSTLMGFRWISISVTPLDTRVTCRASQTEKNNQTKIKKKNNFDLIELTLQCVRQGIRTLNSEHIKRAVCRKERTEQSKWGWRGRRWSQF